MLWYARLGLERACWCLLGGKLTVTVFSALAIRQLFGVAVFALVLAILASGPAVGTASALAASRSPSSTVARRTTPTTTGALGGDWSLFVYGVMMVNTRHATEGSVANWSARPHTDAKETIVRKHAKLWGVILGRQLKKIRNRGTLRGPYEIHPRYSGVICTTVLVTQRFGL